MFVGGGQRTNTRTQFQPDIAVGCREGGRPQLALLFKGGQLHTEADLKFLDAVVEQMESH